MRPGTATFRPNPHRLSDDVSFRFGGVPSAALAFDSAADMLVVRSTNDADQMTDRVSIEAGSATPSIVFNEPGLDLDVRFEGDGDPSLLVLDAGNDAVLVGASAPDGSEKLHVNGTSLFKGDATFKDSVKIILGTGSDASLYYDGANLVIEPRVVGSGNLVLNDPAILFVNETNNANMTVGLTINQAGNADEILAFKSSLTHGATQWAETDTYGRWQLADATYAGMIFRAIALDHPSAVSSLAFQCIGATASTTKTTAATALVQYQIYEHDGAGSDADITANGNLFVVRAQIGGSQLARFLVDEVGDIFVVTAVDVTGSGNAVAATAFDDFADAELVRAFDVARSPESLIRTEWDQHVRYNEQTLIDLGVLGAPVADGGLTNMTQLQRLHNGAIWQQHTAHLSLVEEVAELKSQLKALTEGK